MSQISMDLLNYFSFPIQSNIYGLSCLETNDGTDRLLVSTLERQIFCIENYCTINSCVADISVVMDRTNEIAIGTYGHELIIYKYDLESDSYYLLWEKTFTHSLQSITYLDLTGDGLKELVVLTVKGLYVLQHYLENVIQLCHQKVKNLLKS